MDLPHPIATMAVEYLQKEVVSKGEHKLFRRQRSSLLSPFELCVQFTLSPSTECTEGQNETKERKLNYYLNMHYMFSEQKR